MYKLLFKIGQNLRNPSLKKQLRFLKKTEVWSLEELESYQLRKLNELVTIAKNKSTYYKKLFNEASIQNLKLNSLNDLKKIPITSKKELIQFNNEIHTNLKFNKLFSVNTSGTSGEQLQFKRNEAADSFNRASVFRGYSWYKVQPWEKNGYFWGFNFTLLNRLKIYFFDILLHRFRLFSYNSKELYSFYKKLSKASYLHGYSSMIYEISKFINNKNLPKPPNIKMIKGTSEKIEDVYQHEVQEAFGIKMISEYGAAETGIIAFECPKGNMHINMEGVLVEEIDNEIIVTNLQMHSFPVIRYKLGDYIKLSDTKNCSCGMKHSILEEIGGRVGDVVCGFKSTYPSLYFYYIFKNVSKKHKLDLSYQVIQSKKGYLDVNIEQPLSNVHIEFIINEFSNYFNKDIIVEINDETLMDLKTRKRKSFISNIYNDG